MKNISLVIDKKINNKWKETYKTTDEKEIYKALAQNVIAKKFHKCSYIRSIKECTNYDGTRKVVVYYDNGVRATYTIYDF